MDVTITLTIEQAIELQTAIRTRLYHLHEELERLRKIQISGAEESKGRYQRAAAAINLPACRMTNHG